MSVKAAGRFDQKKTSVFTNKPLDKINSQKCLCPNNLTNVVFFIIIFHWTKTKRHSCAQLWSNKLFTSSNLVSCLDSLSRTINNEQIRWLSQATRKFTNWVQGSGTSVSKYQDWKHVVCVWNVTHVPCSNTQGLSYKLNALLLLKIRVVGRHKVPTLAPGQHVYTHT